MFKYRDKHLQGHEIKKTIRNRLPYPYIINIKSPVRNNEVGEKGNNENRVKCGKNDPFITDRADIPRETSPHNHNGQKH